MKKALKTYVAVSVLLVMLTNISYSVTYSFCGMTSMSKCTCDMDNKTPQNAFKKISCCKEEVKNISNNADFTKLQENTTQKIPETFMVSVSYFAGVLIGKSTPEENLLFYIPKRDLPVKFSRLRI